MKRIILSRFSMSFFSYSFFCWHSYHEIPCFTLRRIPARYAHVKQHSLDEYRPPAAENRAPAETRPVTTRLALDNPNYDEVLTPALQQPENERFSSPDPAEDFPPPPKELLSPSPAVSKSPTEASSSLSRTSPPSAKSPPQPSHQNQPITVKSKVGVGFCEAVLCF